MHWRCVISVSVKEILVSPIGLHILVSIQKAARLYLALCCEHYLEHLTMLTTLIRAVMCTRSTWSCTALSITGLLIGVAIVANKKALFVTIVGSANQFESILKPVFHQTQRILCAYETFRHLHVCPWTTTDFTPCVVLM